MAHTIRSWARDVRGCDGPAIEKPANRAVSQTRKAGRAEKRVRKPPGRLGSTMPILSAASRVSRRRAMHSAQEHGAAKRLVPDGDRAAFQLYEGQDKGDGDVCPT